jgi:hypothetical protein
MYRLVLIAAVVIACAPTAPPAATAASPALVPIRADELRSDLFVFASDSFAGRETGTSGSLRAARFLVDRLVQLGLEPAGDSLYMQRVPLVKQSFGPQTSFSVTQGQSTSPLSLADDLLPFISLGPGAMTKRAAEGDIVFAGYGLNSHGRSDFSGISQEGKVIVMLHGAPPTVTDSATRAALESQMELQNRALRALQLRPAAIILLMTGPNVDFYHQAAPQLLRGVVHAPGDQTTSDAQRVVPMFMIGIAKEGSLLLPSGWPADDSPQALTGRRFKGQVALQQDPFTAYNVAAIARGTDPRLNKTYVAYGSHYDHVGINSGLSPDSIANGADDDGSGSVTMLAIAKSVMAARPRRSVLFVWHTGEEKGLLGSEYFTDHPTVPIDSIVAQLNADMIGRRGGPNPTFNSAISGAQAANRVYVVGPSAAPNGQSRVLGAILDTVNARQMLPMELDREWDSPTHPERIYFRSDHYNYARKGIPIIFFTTGLHEDYHKVSDEADKIDYEKMARVGSLLLELGTTVANREARPR